MEKTWPNFLVCPVCGEDVPVNQMKAEYAGHKVDHKSLNWDTYILAAEQNRMMESE